jgi:hypothetical protein
VTLFWAGFSWVPKINMDCCGTVQH